MKSMIIKYIDIINMNIINDKYMKYLYIKIKQIKSNPYEKNYFLQHIFFLRVSTSILPEEDILKVCLFSSEFLFSK